ncbi:heparinase II/III family protein [Halorussus salilacus]|uniref:alginate lyase family protein n=1 Tax=Halorussus salilacus TaxID=2953750 RepID=UPI0020A1EF78|nr:alginate lyase family protein [Halorussus salilacus]USZ67397.1 heparinase II/III family protein [Halorussus salilacus]
MTGTGRPRELVFKTAINKRPVQLAGIIERKLRNAILPQLPFDFDARYEQRIPGTIRPTPDPIRANIITLHDALSNDERREYGRKAAAFADGDVTFLNRTLSFDGPSDISTGDNRVESLPRLWKLKLDAFEPASWAILGSHDSDVTEEVGDVVEAWTDSWLASNRIGNREGYLRRAWTPYAVSLRIMNWCRYCAWRGPQAVDESLLRAVYKNALFLSNHVEWDVDGNHLVENGAALVMAGIFFEEHDQNWIEAGLEVLESVARTQFCEDGCHFERSPMYHILVLTRLLTVLDLLSETSRAWPAKLEATASVATGFLSAIRPPDGRIPLLNDSVFGEAFELDSCLRYADEVGVSSEESQSTLNGSGYCWLGEGGDRLLFDCGASGPSHLLAHAHNDALSVLAWVDGDRVLTDTGCFDYKPGRRRTAARSVEGHNTVQVGEKEPADIGHRFLMSHRVEPEATHVDGDIEVVEGHYQAESGYCHRRRVYYDDDWWLVEDEVTDTDDPIVSRLHVHPAVESTGTTPIELSRDGVSRGQIWPLDVEEIDQTTSEYYPRFGVAETRSVIEFTTFDGVSRYLFSSTRRSEVEVEANADGTGTIAIDGVKYELPRKESI